MSIVWLLAIVIVPVVGGWVAWWELGSPAGGGDCGAGDEAVDYAQYDGCLAWGLHCYRLDV